MQMTFDEYQRAATKTAKYPNAEGVQYCALGLASEAGEVCDKLKKSIRDNWTIQRLREELTAEIGDVLWYAAMLAQEFSLPLDFIARENLAKLADRQERGAIGGSGDHR